MPSVGKISVGSKVYDRPMASVGKVCSDEQEETLGELVARKRARSEDDKVVELGGGIGDAPDVSPGVWQSILFTAHSLKNGAANVLMHHANLGRVNKSLIPRVTKHSEGDKSERLPSVTQGYFKDKVRRAQLLEAEKVTVWFDPFRVENL